jgi:hypothetical protein
MKHLPVTARGMFLLAVILLLLPALLRTLGHQPIVSGAESYGSLRIAETIAESGIPEFDPAMPERRYALSVFDLLLALFVLVLGSTAAALVVPFVLGVTAVALLALIVRRWKLPADAALGAQLVFVLSPLFVGVFTQAVPAGLQLVLLLAFIALLAPVEATTPARQAVRIAGLIALAALLASFSVFAAVAAIALPPLARKLRRGVPQPVLLACVAAFIVLVTVALPAQLQAERAPYAAAVPFVTAISDFSGSDGISIFAVLLACISITLLWRFKQKYFAALIAGMMTILLALVLPSALVFGHVVIALLAGYALAFFATMRWSFDDIRVLTLLVLACGLLFSTLAHAVTLAQGPPSAALRDAAQALSAVLPNDAVLLAHPDDGFALAYWSGKRVFMDGWGARTPDAQQRWAAAQSVWHAQDIEKLQPVLARNRIGAVVITKDMRSGKVWDLPEQGLLFLLRNNETFKSVYRDSSVDIWAVAPAFAGR